MPEAQHGPEDRSEPIFSRLGLVSTEWPPFTDVEGKPRVALALVHAALARAAIEADTRIIPTTDWAPALRGGQADGSAAAWYSSEREEFLLYSRPYLENRLVIVAAKGTDVSPRTLEALKNKRVGIVDTYAYGDDVGEAVGPTFVKGQSTESNLRALVAKQLDYVLADALLVHHLFQQAPVKAKEHFDVGTHPLIKRTLHFTVRRAHPRAARIIELFNQEIDGMLRDGSYNRALQVDWIQADVDGDGRSEFVLGGSRAGTAPPETGYQPLTEPLGPARTSAAVLGPGPGIAPAAERHRFVVQGHVYDSWDEIPEIYKAEPDHIDPVPETIRFNVFEF